MHLDENLATVHTKELLSNLPLCRCFEYCLAPPIADLQRIMLDVVGSKVGPRLLVPEAAWHPSQLHSTKRSWLDWQLNLSSALVMGQCPPLGTRCSNTLPPLTASVTQGGIFTLLHGRASPLRKLSIYFFLAIYLKHRSILPTKHYLPMISTLACPSTSGGWSKSDTAPPASAGCLPAFLSMTIPKGWHCQLASPWSQCCPCRIHQGGRQEQSWI